MFGPEDPDFFDELAEFEEFEDEFDNDGWHDAETFASIGWGTDEDYGYFGD